MHRIDQLPGFALDVKRDFVVQIPFDPAGGDQGAELQVAKAQGLG